MRPAAKLSNCERDSQKSSTPQPPSIGPDAWKISPSGSSTRGLIAASSLSNCSASTPASLMRIPTAITAPLFRWVIGTYSIRSAPMLHARRASLDGPHQPANLARGPSAALPYLSPRRECSRWLMIDRLRDPALDGRPAHSPGLGAARLGPIPLTY